MPYCSRCGVEVEENTVSCPLCSSPIQHLDKNNRPITYYPSDVPHEPGYKRRFHQGAFTLFISILFFIPIAVTLTSDLIHSGTITWSAIPAIALLASWGLFFIVIQLYNSPIALGIAFFADLALFLFALARLIPGGKEWFLPLGLSIAAVVFFTTLLMVLYILFTKSKGFNLIGAVLLAASIICFFIDLFVSRYLPPAGKIHLSWSYFVILSCPPLSLFFFYLHYFKKIPLKFKRIFHV